MPLPSILKGKLRLPVIAAPMFPVSGPAAEFKSYRLAPDVQGSPSIRANA